MALLRHISQGLRALLNRSRRDRDLKDEVDDFVRRATDAHIANGLSPGEARRTVRLEMGAALGVREEVRSSGWESRVETVLADLRYAARTLRAAPGFTIVVILTLALGVGANTAIFSVVYAALLRPLPYFQPDRLLTLTEIRAKTEGRNWNASYPDFLDWQKQSKTFQKLAAFTGDGSVLRGNAEPEPLAGVGVTPNFFSTLGVKPVLGRDFATGEDIESGPNVVILTHDFWQSHFGGATDVIGQALRLDDHSATIIGVLPRDFEFAPVGTVQYWVPLHIGSDLATRRNLRWISVIGRLADSVTEAGVYSEMSLINRRLSAEYPEQNGAVEVVIRSLRERIVGPVQPLLLILMGAVAIVLLIACCNVCNLLVVRIARRQHEFSIRSALGAGWGRLVSQTLAETGLLTAIGSVLGCLLARWGTTLLVLPIPKSQLASMPFLLDVHANTTVLAFVCAIAVIIAVGSGMIGALESFHHSRSGVIYEGGRSSTGRRQGRLRSVLVVSEVAFAVILLVGAGLMGRSLMTLLFRNAGFDRHNLLVFGVSLSPTAYPKPTDRGRFDQEFSSAIRSLPGVTDVATTSIPPLTGGGNSIRFIIENQAVAAGQENECIIRSVSVNYFSMMAIQLISGRYFDDRIDTPESPPRLIVSQAWVQRYMPGENPLGQRIRFTNSPTQPFREIIGVVGDIADADLDSPIEPSIYAPNRQTAPPFIPYVVRTSVPPAALIRAIRSALSGVDSGLVMILPRTMDEIAGQSPSVFLRRYPSYLIGSFAALALFLAILGLYGLISYSVAQRTRELGLRIALGAHPASVMKLVLGQGTRLILIGVVVGVGTSLALTRLLHSLLFGISSVDPITFATVIALLAAVAGVACAIPARRALRIDPIDALREM